MGRAKRCGNQRGFALVAAIFVLVVFGALGGYMMTMMSVQLETSPLQLLGARAYQAARAGLEWGVHQSVNAPASTCGAAPASPMTHNLSLTEGTLNGFDVEIICQYDRFEEGGECFNIYRLEVFSERGNFGESGYAARRLQGRVNGPAGACP